MKLLLVILSMGVTACLSEAPYPPVGAPPYPPSGTKPQGPQLVLPTEYGPPKPSYGSPKPDYGPPKPDYGPPKPDNVPPMPDYGPPKPDYGQPASNDTAPEETTEPTRGDGGAEGATARLMAALSRIPGSERFVYHIYLSDGRLQRVRYTAAPLDKFQSGGQLSDNYYDSATTRFQAQKSQQGYLPPPASEEPGQAEGSRLKLASVHFMDVQPIPGPIYNLDKKQLTRIIRTAD